MQALFCLADDDDDVKSFVPVLLKCVETFLRQHNNSRDFAIWLLALEFSAGQAKMSWEVPELATPLCVVLRSVLGPPMSVQLCRPSGAPSDMDIINQKGCSSNDEATAVAQFAICVTSLGKVRPCMICGLIICPWISSTRTPCEGNSALAIFGAAQHPVRIQIEASTGTTTPTIVILCRIASCTMLHCDLTLVSPACIIFLLL